VRNLSQNGSDGMKASGNAVIVEDRKRREGERLKGLNFGEPIEIAPGGWGQVLPEG